MKRLILAALLGGAALTGGCAAGPYYDGYGYYPDSYGYPGYQAYDPYYYGPSVGVGVGVTFSDQDRYWRDHGQRWRDGDGRWHDGDNRWRDRGTSPRSDPVIRNNNNSDIRNNNGTPTWSQGDTYRGTGPNYDPSRDHGQYSPG